MVPVCHNLAPLRSSASSGYQVCALVAGAPVIGDGDWQFCNRSPGEVIPRIRILLGLDYYFVNGRRVGFPEHCQPCADCCFLTGGHHFYPPCHPIKCDGSSFRSPTATRNILSNLFESNRRAAFLFVVFIEHLHRSSLTHEYALQARYQVRFCCNAPVAPSL